MTKEIFIKEIEKLGITLTKNQQEQLNDYYKLLIEENKKQNLTRITDEHEVYLKHFYDSLTISKSIDLNKDLKIIDIGTGAGFPGIVLKIAYPKLDITLLDSLNKRIEFLNKVIEKLDLKKIKAVHSRIEEYRSETFDIVVSRAVAKTNILLELSCQLLKENGDYILLKSNVKEELEEAMNTMKKLNLKITEINEFNLPIENSKRAIIKVKKTRSIPNKYPRNFTKIKKNPL